MNCSFQDYENLYLVMDLLTGGDLRYHISRQRKFNEEQTSIFLFLNFRIFCGMYYPRVGICTFKKSYSS